MGHSSFRGHSSTTSSSFEIATTSLRRSNTRLRLRLMPVAAEWIGDTQLLYASDYPHWDSDWPHTVKTVRDRTDLTDEQKRRILGENALRFYGMGVPVGSS